MDYSKASQIFPPPFQYLEIIIKDNSKEEYHERICEDLKGNYFVIMENRLREKWIYIYLLFKGTHV